MSEELAKLIHVLMQNQLLTRLGIKGISLHMGTPYCALKSLQRHALRVCLRNEEICLYATMPVAYKI